MVPEVAALIKAESNFLLTTGSPDGDAVGSMLALTLGLKGQGKTVQIFSPESLPDHFSFLPGLEHVVYALPAKSFDLLVVMDTGSYKLLFDGDKTILKKLAKNVVNLDHHPDNDHFGDFNVVLPKAASTGEIAFQLLKALDIPLTKEIATCLLTAVMSDTGVFRYPNVTPTTYQIASELLSTGIDNGAISRHLYSSHSIHYGKILGRMFENLKLDLNDQLGWSILKKEDFQAYDAPDETADKMVEQLDMLQPLKVYALIREFSDGKIKVSLRSRSNIPVNQVAAKFGGGGHRQAAGCQLTGSVKEAEQKIVSALRELFIKQ